MPATSLQVEWLLWVIFVCHDAPPSTPVLPSPAEGPAGCVEASPDAREESPEAAGRNRSRGGGLPGAVGLHQKLQVAHFRPGGRHRGNLGL
jgi:hypothetical protein